MERCGKTHDVTTHQRIGFSRIQLGQIGGSSSNYSIWRSRPSSRWRGNLIATSQVNPDAAKRWRRQRPIYDRPLVSINGGIKCVSHTPACSMSPRTLAPLCSPLDPPCHCVAIAGNTCRSFACSVLLVPIPDQAQYALGLTTTPHIASIGFDEVFCSRVSLAQ